MIVERKTFTKLLNSSKLVVLTDGVVVSKWRQHWLATIPVFHTYDKQTNINETKQIESNQHFSFLSYRTNMQCLKQRKQIVNVIAHRIRRQCPSSIYVTSRCYINGSIIQFQNTYTHTHTPAFRFAQQRDVFEACLIEWQSSNTTLDKKKRLINSPKTFRINANYRCQ